MYDGMLAETVAVAGDGDDLIAAYLARPLAPGPLAGVVIAHHMPGWDEWTKEVVRHFARNGYLAICPHLFHREAPGASPDDAAAAARAIGGAPDDRVMGDLAGAAAVLRAMPNSNGKVAVLGHCSGGRQAYLAACQLAIDAAVDCYGGGVVMEPEHLSPARPVAPIDLTPQMRAPLLGLFGNDDRAPTPEQVDEIEAALQATGKTYEFHRYDGAGHAFFCTVRPSYRVEAALDGWERIFSFLGRHLDAATTPEA
jgi:carboxymethylenebutenolidase